MELMDKVIDNLWIGGLVAALDADLLRQHGIKSVLTAMRGKIAIPKTFLQYQVLLDDTNEADALVHFPACNAWIESEIKKGRGVLVHCQAGLSRSAAIIAAYLMYSRRLDVEDALEMIRRVRPMIQPNDGFMAQLVLFHNARYKRTSQNKETRTFYVERAAKEVLNGDGSSLEMDMFAKYPRTPSDSIPTTPFHQPRRRIRCKMCRQELATREHMVDHGQVGPATPASASMLSPAASRRSSAGESVAALRQGSVTAESVLSPRRRSGPAEVVKRSPFGALVTSRTPVIYSSEAILEEAAAVENDQHPHVSEINQSPRESADASSTEGPPMSSVIGQTADRHSSRQRGVSLEDSSGRPSLLGAKIGNMEQQPNEIETPSISTTQSDETCDPQSRTVDDRPSNDIESDPSRLASPSPSSPSLASPKELAAQIHPTLAALRSSPLISALTSSGSLGMTPLRGDISRTTVASISPPLLMPNANCSGYFVEPMKWMEPFLEAGQMEGKITCPNKKCGAKLGNYDWAGVKCSCKEWVVPGFCIHKSKVDEVVI